MKNWIAILTFSVLTANLYAQEKAPAIDSVYNNSHYRERMDIFSKMPVTKKAIVFLGNSITEAGKWQEILPGKPVLNRGISGDITFGVIARLESILVNKPERIFLLIGVNDLKREVPSPVIIDNYKRIVATIRATSPRTKIFLQSVLPVNDSMLIPSFKKVTNAKIKQLNEALLSMADNKHIRYVNLHEVFADANGQLKAEETPDGIHVKVTSYVAWVNYLQQKGYL